MAATDNPCIPEHEPGARVTCKADAAVTGKTFVDIAGAREQGLILIDEATAEGLIFGVAAHDAAQDEILTVLTGGIVPVTAGSGGVTAGQEVEVGADGTAVTLADGIAVGRATSTATATNDVLIYLYASGGVAAGHTHA